MLFLNHEAAAGCRYEYTTLPIILQVQIPRGRSGLARVKLDEPQGTQADSWKWLRLRNVLCHSNVGGEATWSHRLAVKVVKWGRSQ